ncbi:nose resistant to fluoxetine protein 6-like [Amblyomma americanum]
MGTIAAAACLATGIQVYVQESLPFNLVVTTDIKKLIDMHLDIYLMAHTHAPPLFVGIIFGCLATRRHRMSSLAQGAAWLVAATVSLAALMGVRTWNVGRQPERLESAIYAGLHRASWGLGVAWVMYACATKRGGFVNKILAWPIFYPLGRLSFSVYLVHLILMACNSVLSRERVTQHPFLHAQMYVSTAITAYALASIVYLLIECPVAALDNLVFHKMMPKETILKVIQGKGTAQEVKAIQALAEGKKKKPVESPAKGKNISELPDFTKINLDGHHCHVNGACEIDSNEDTSANGAVISAKF